MEKKKVILSECVNVLYKCSNCNESIDIERFHGEPLNYCPNCGVEFIGAINRETKEFMRRNPHVKLRE